MRSTIIGLAALLVLGGCAREYWVMQSEEELTAQDAQTCTSYGIPHGHPDFGDCMLGLAQLRLQERAARTAAFSSMAPYLLAPKPAVSPQSTTNCTTWQSPIGPYGSITCR